VTTRLVVVGAGGFGRETLDVLRAINRSSQEPVFEVLGVLDSNPSASNLDALNKMQIAWLGGESDWLASGDDASYLIGIGNPAVRERIAQLFDGVGLAAATVIHPHASVGSISQFGEGSIVCAGAQISTNVVLGRHVHINPNATIGHDSKIADFASVNPGAVISGNVEIRRRSLVGAGAVILQGLVVGEESVVGAGACVVRSVDASQTVKGIPAR